MGRLDIVTEWLDWYLASGASRGTEHRPGDIIKLLTKS